MVSSAFVLAPSLLSNHHISPRNCSLQHSTFTSTRAFRTLAKPLRQQFNTFQIRACSTSPELQDAEQPAEQLNSSFSSNIRKLLAVLSFAGCLETTYLTFNKLFSSPGAICATQGCLDVLSGPFSSFLGIPLTLFGLIAYASFAYLAIWPLVATEQEVLISDDSEETELYSAAEVYARRDAVTRPLLLAISSAMAVFSAYLMSILIFVIKSMCPYCLFSAAISTILFIITAFVGRAVPSPGTALKISGGATLLASLGAAALFFVSMPAQILAQAPSEPQSPPAITMNSTKDTMVSCV